MSTDTLGRRTKFQREIIPLAIEMGFELVRVTHHEGILIRHKTTGCHTVIPSTPKSEWHAKTDAIARMKRAARGVQYGAAQ